MGSCEADASASCEASADASVECEGRCEGEVNPPSVKAECEATVEAKANASVECTPPALEITWQWNVDAGIDGDVNAQAEFKAWLQGFKGHLSVMLAARGKATILIDSLGLLRDSGVAALTGSVDTLASGDFVATFKLTTCALPELEAVGSLLTNSTTRLQGEVSSTIDVFASVGI